MPDQPRRRGKQCRPTRQDEARYWHLLRDLADHGDAHAAGLLLILREIRNLNEGRV
ncbi:hypothetical protein [Halomonas sp. H5]|uniref:hypothetical protein n=1 Tax=Halomonas sp. H5 TaxID=3423910 RepID=UPI003D36256D